MNSNGNIADHGAGGLREIASISNGISADPLRSFNQDKGRASVNTEFRSQVRVVNEMTGGLTGYEARMKLLSMNPADLRDQWVVRR